MLEILPNTDKPLLASYCKKCGVIPGDEHYLYVAANRGKILAAGLFEMQGDRVAVIYYDTEDESDYFLFDGILRAGLNFAAEQGVETGFIPESFRQRHSGAFGKLNYPPAPEMNIVNFFAKYKNCR